MVVSVNYELITFAASFAASVIFGLVYDLARAFSKTTEKNAVFDILFWSVTCLFCGGIWFFILNGELRWYMLVAAVFGAILYFLTVEKYIFTIFLFLAKFICIFFDIILKILLTPPRFLCKILSVYIKMVKAKFFREVRDKNGQEKASNTT